MATKFYLDTRAVKDGEPAPLKLAISRKGTRSFLTLSVSVTKDQWDAKALKVVKHPSRVSINNYINLRKSTVDMMILRLTSTGEIGGMTAKDIRDLAIREVSDTPIEGQEEDKPTFYSVFIAHQNSRNRPKTKAVYQHTLNRITAFCGDVELLLFEDITKDWLMSFDEFLSKTSPSQNARSIHFRNIRTVFKAAMDEGYITHHPFHKFKIKTVETVKRSLSIEELRKLFNYPVKESQRQYLDMFKLSFFLVGINLIDLCNLKEIKDGMVEYYRAKTNRLYQIKVEPEAMDIIEKYRGKNYLLNILDRYKLHENYRHRMNKNLQQIGEVVVGKRGKLTHHPEFPKLTSYWARHTWATIASDLDVPEDVIRRALGHGRKTVTDTYINFDPKKIAIANRKVIDYVLYGKK